MNAITPFIFEDQLVRTVMRGDEPWFVGRDVCHVLAIRNESDAMSRLDDDERSEVAISDPSGTKTAIAVSEPGVFRLIFTSRKPEAERFKRWLAHEVLPSLRRTGHFGQPAAGKASTGIDITTEAVPVLTTKLAMVREARHLWGHERARAVWKSLGLAVPPCDVDHGTGEAVECLHYLLGGELHSHTLLHLLNLALDGDSDTASVLREGGIWAEPDNDGFVIANRNPVLERVMQGSKWATSGWHAVLRRLPGSLPAKPRRYAHNNTARGVFIPTACLDHEA